MKQGREKDRKTKTGYKKGKETMENEKGDKKEFVEKDTDKMKRNRKREGERKQIATH